MMDEETGRSISLAALVALALIIALGFYFLMLAVAHAEVVGSRPSECPRRYCGCAISLRLFNKVIPPLNLAANWPKVFSRAAPAPGRVAARPGHVMLLLYHVRGREWMSYDPNSGKGLTREHVRSIAGFTIVNPYVRVATR